MKIHSEQNVEESFKKLRKPSHLLTWLLYVQSFHRSCTAQSTLLLHPSYNVLLPFFHLSWLPSSAHPCTVLFGERSVNANERWQSATRTVHGLYEDACGMFRGGGCDRWVSFVHRASVRVLMPIPHRPLATVHRLERSHNAHRAFPQEIVGHSKKLSPWAKYEPPPPSLGDFWRHWSLDTLLYDYLLVCNKNLGIWKNTGPSNICTPPPNFKR